MSNTPKPNAQERNQKVLDVLNSLTTEPLGPSDIAAKINEPWCMYRGTECPMSSAISPVCKRIGAVVADREKFGFGKWFAPGRSPLTGKPVGKK